MPNSSLDIKVRFYEMSIKKKTLYLVVKLIFTAYYYLIEVLAYSVYLDLTRVGRRHPSDSPESESVSPVHSEPQEE